MKKVLGILAILVAIPAHAQFNGYVGLQTVMVPVVQNSSATGRFRVNSNIGASYHTFTYCLSTPATALQLIVEQSPDGQDAHFTQVSPISEFPWQAINSNNCGIIRVGGYYSVMAINVLLLTGGTLSVWYSATAGPTDIFPPAVNSSGGTSPIACDQSIAINQLAAGGTYQLVPGNPNQGIYVCGGTLSFDAATTAGSEELVVANANCGGISLTTAARPRVARPRLSGPQVRTPAKPAGRPPALAAGTPVWFTYITPASPQLFPINASSATIRIPPTTTGSTLCLVVGTVTANTAITLQFAQF